MKNTYCFVNYGHKLALLVAHNYRPMSRWWVDRCRDATTWSLFREGLCTVNDIFLAGLSLCLVMGELLDSGKKSGVWTLYLLLSSHLSFRGPETREARYRRTLPTITWYSTSRLLL